MSSIASKDVISDLSLCFSVFGTSEEIICDNAKSFTTRDYIDFPAILEFLLTTSRPQ